MTLVCGGWDPSVGPGTLGLGLNQLDRSDRFRPISDLSPDQLDPIIQLVETEMVGACLECHASGSLL